jgi:hypothetical protein
MMRHLPRCGRDAPRFVHRGWEAGVPDVERLIAADYVQDRGFPSAEMARAAYDDVDLNRAIQAYRFFFPAVSALAIVKGNEDVGLSPTRCSGCLIPSRNTLGSR